MNEIERMGNSLQRKRKKHKKTLENDYFGEKQDSNSIP
jgi:hypothetical protein